tara:strand:- start:513 stop:1763 length:1251 start_codon:yes stop_codon:yes gene_type:complete
MAGIFGFATKDCQMTLHPRHNLAISTILGSLAFTVPALALDADDFATKVAALVGQGSAKVSFSSVEPDGDTIVLKSVRMEAPGEPAVEFGDITFDGVEDETGGSYHVDQAIFQDIDFTRDGVRITVDDMELSGLTIPADLDADPIDTISFYEGFSTGMIRVEKDRKEIFSMAGTILDIDRADDDASIGMKMDGSDISVDLSQIKDPKARRALSDLGYTTLSGDLKFDGIWELASGTLNIREYSLNLDEVGRLAVALEVSGYTRDFIKAIQQAKTAAAANPDPQAAQQSMGIVMMGMLQQLSFKSASVQFEDDSVTEKALAYAGKQQGVTGEQMRQSVKFMLPLMLGQLGIPALQQQISAAANVYLDNPETITITAKPANPVAVPVIMGAGMGDPKSLVDLLNVQVTANEPVLLCCE